MATAIKRARRSTADVPPVPGPLPRDAELVARLERDGYAVLRGALAPEEAARARALAWDWLEALAPAVRRGDPRTWTSRNVPQLTGGLAKGLVQFYGVGWNAADVYVRDLVKPVFERIYGTKRLWSSFGGFSVSMRPREDRFCSFRDLEDWAARRFEGGRLHVDQTRFSGHLCYQGGVALTDQREDGHVFVCVPGSHLLHAELLAAGDASKLHWMELSAGQMEMLRARGLEPRRVALRPGDMVLWDSRTVHANTGWCATAPRGAERLQSLICMAPAPPADSRLHADEMAFRRDCYARRATSKHTPVPVRVFPPKPRKYGAAQFAPEPMPPAALTAPQRMLHGLQPYPADVA